MPSISKDTALEKNKVPPPPPTPGPGQECQEFRRRKIKASTLSNFFSKVKSGGEITISPNINVCNSRHNPWICIIMALDIFPSHPPVHKKKKILRVFIGVFMLHKC